MSDACVEVDGAVGSVAVAEAPESYAASSSSPNKKKKNSNFFLVKLYRARSIILQLHGARYDTSEYADFTINEMDAMIKHSQCDMLLVEREEAISGQEKEGGGGVEGEKAETQTQTQTRREAEGGTQRRERKKLYIIFHNVNGQKSIKTIRKPVVDEYVQDLFFVERVLSKQDTLVIIIDDEPNDTMKACVKTLFDKDGIYVILMNILRLQFNITRYRGVPPHRIMDDAEKAALFERYHLTSEAQLPEISRFDPVAMAIGLRPHEVCCISRKSPTALVHHYYRICV